MTDISKHHGRWSPQALVVSAIAEGGAPQLALTAYKFNNDDAWAKEML